MESNGSNIFGWYVIVLEELGNIIHRDIKRQTHYIQILLVDEYVKILQEAYQEIYQVLNKVQDK